MLAGKIAAAAGVGAGAYYMAQTNQPVLGMRRSNIFAASPAAAEPRGVMYYVKAALAGGICCSITHGGMTVSSCAVLTFELFVRESMRHFISAYVRGSRDAGVHRRDHRSMANFILVDLRAFDPAAG